MISGIISIPGENFMLNELLTRLRCFSFKFCETVLQSSGRALRDFFRCIHREAVVLTFGIIGLAFAALCVLGTLSSSAREPSV
jgi:hypothetical protein